MRNSHSMTRIAATEYWYRSLELSHFRLTGAREGDNAAGGKHHGRLWKTRACAVGRVTPVGLEPTTKGLKVPCSTN
jgi:hypothetical protein